MILNTGLASALGAHPIYVPPRRLLGVCVVCGIRGAQGFWRSYPPLAKLGITFNESMDPSWFKQVRVPDGLVLG